MTTAPMSDRVAAGAALLDERRPGWAADVDPDGLEMRGCLECVLGQLFGQYEQGLGRLDIPTSAARGFAAERFGFDVYASDGDAAYDALNDLWREQIAARTVPAKGGAA